LGVEAKQAMDLTTLKTINKCCKSGMDTEEMAKDHEKRKLGAMKFLKKA
jgi:hypothetical protein